MLRSRSNFEIATGLPPLYETEAFGNLESTLP